VGRRAGDTGFGERVLEERVVFVAEVVVPEEEAASI
jgi:hypothetical protein